MTSYPALLEAYLRRDGNTELALAEAIRKTQPAVHRYRKGDRFPDAQTARDIEVATAGEVSFAAWQTDFLARSGIEAAPASEAA